MKCFFELLDQKDLTSFKIRYNYKTDIFRFELAKEWEKETDFSLYPSAFSERDILIQNTVSYNTEECVKIISEAEMMEYLQEIMQLIRKGKHSGMEMYYNKKKKIKFVLYEHSTKRGMMNKSQATVCGGIRRHPQNLIEKEVLADGLNLSRAMSFKNYAAGIPFGGCKATVQMEGNELYDRETLGFLGFVIDRSRCLVAPDMNLPAMLADLLKEERITMQCVGGENAKIGSTGKPTAYGVYLSMKEAVYHKEGTKSLQGKTIALMGLGAVGKNLAEYLLEEDVTLYIADIDEEKVRKFIQNHSQKRIFLTKNEELIEMKADILSLCAAGSIINENNIPRLNCRYIWGSANNQLRAASPDEELLLAQKLMDRDILYQAEWWHNTAGVICMAEEYLYDGSAETLFKKIERIIPTATRENLQEAARLEITPTACCYKKSEAAIY